MGISQIHPKGEVTALIWSGLTWEVCMGLPSMNKQLLYSHVNLRGQTHWASAQFTPKVWLICECGLSASVYGININAYYHNDLI